MDPSKDSDWLGCKDDHVEEPQNVGNIARSWQWRATGVDPPNSPSNKKVLEDLAEDILVQKELKIRGCDLPGYPRSTFLMVFSPDGTKVASSHGNHSVYVTELASGKHLRKLKGHPRTPWCIAFHPAHPQLIGSGCLAGQVRVWDISSGGSEVWNVRNETVIASIAFHPREQLLVIATSNELYFWDWSQPAPFTKVCTNNINEKVRYVAFDGLGSKLITGISLWGHPHVTTNSSFFQQAPVSPTPPPNRRDDATENVTITRPPDIEANNAQDIIVNSYQTLVQRYDSLVRNYQRLFMVRHRLTNTPPPTNTIDRGTDPMETDNSQSDTSWRPVRPSTSSINDETDPSPSTSRRTDAGDSGDGEGSSSRLLNLDVLSFSNESPRREENSEETSTFGSRPSAFQPLNESARRSFRTVEQSERTRLLPNPFSSRSSASPSPSPSLNPRGHSARVAASLRPAPPPRAGRRHAASQPAPRPPTADSSTQMSPAHTINESLDLIRDILRDSGTRLLNLITDMSLSTLASVERGARPRPRLRLLGPRLRRDPLASTSDSDSDHSLEVNILRTRNSTFRDDSTEDADDSMRETSGNPVDSAATADEPTPSGSAEAPPPPTDRLVFELGEESRSADERRDTGGINVSASGGRFRVRTQSATERSEPERRRGTRRDSSPRPSTSRDNFWTRGCFVPPDEAFRKVRGGVVALQKHTSVLSNMWLRGARTGLRELRTMWENLRRRVLALHRDTGRQDLPSYYTRSLLERCMMLTDVATRGAGRGEAGGAAGAGAVPPPVPPRVGRGRSSPRARSSPPLRRRLHPRWRPEDELLRRRSRNPAGYRLSQCHSTRSRRDFARAVEISATRHEIRMRAMQVLSVMFNMMMMCLEERGLSQLIITMLRSLKKALALTCLMLMTNRTPNRSSGSQTSAGGRRFPSLDVVRIQNEDHQGPVNVDGPEESASPRPSTSSGIEEERPPRARDDQPADDAVPSTSAAVHTGPAAPAPPRNATNAAAERWSNRLAVQIAAANRNNSPTARTRFDLYVECKRQKALHRTNPSVHPISKRRNLRPVTNYRIPILRRLPMKPAAPPRADQVSSTDEPVAGPSGLSSGTDQNNENARGDVMNEFEHRVNLIRIAHMQAVRLRNAARNRFRRLQTIRLYTPSSVREMFTLQSTNADAPAGNRSPGSSDVGARRRFITYRPFSTVRNENEPRTNDELAEDIHTVFSNTTVMRVNQVPAPDANANNQPQQSYPPMRLPRIHEYLQPIILAQNAMVVDDEGNGDGVAGGEGAGGGGGGGEGGPGGGGSGGGGGGGGGGSGGSGSRIFIGPQRVRGMAGLLDAGIISEALPAPSHRVQAWDFTTGDTPDIADNNKNVVVQRCRIHNDASIDISKDGRLLVALLPVPRLRNTNHWLGVYSLEWRRLGQCLHTAVLEQSAVSVALSPTARHLAVGLGSRRFTTLSHTRNNVFALVYKLEPLESSSRTGLSPIKELEQNWEHGFTSLNCLRWAPQPGQGLVYANNTGELIIMS